MMFCQQCGESLQPDANFCPKCGLAIPRLGNDLSKGNSSSNLAVKGNREIWNPNAACNWSIIFTPAFGSYLHALNWRTLGEEHRAKSAIGWFYSSLTMLAIYILLGLFMEDENASQNLARALGLLYLIVWYFFAGKAQAKYIKAKFGGDYPRRPWGKPLLIGFMAMVGYLVVIVMMGFIVGIIKQTSTY